LQIIGCQTSEFGFEESELWDLKMANYCCEETQLLQTISQFWRTFEKVKNGTQ